VGGIGIAVAVVTIAVVMLMGGGNGRPQKNAPPPVHADGGVVQVAIDAQPDPLKVKLTIVTDPPNAELSKESEPIGRSPKTIELVKNNKDVLFTAQLDGYEDGKVTINPWEHEDGQTIPLKLKKLPKGTPPRPPRQGAGSGSATPAPHGGNAGGELTGYPGLGSGTVPNR
jgi:hypothetical protein